MKKGKSFHDRFVRFSLSHPKVIQEFFHLSLPEEIKNIIDLSSIKLEKDSFIDNKLKLQIADLLYSANLQGKPGFLYLLVEHASSPNVMLPFRILRYMVAIMEQHLKGSKTYKSPLIYPLILYAGNRPFTHSTDICDLFSDEEKEHARKIWTSPYPLVDLTRIKDEELYPLRWFGAMALTVKHIQDSDIRPFLKKLTNSLKYLESQGGEDYIYGVLTYIMSAGRTESREYLIQTIKSLKFIDKEKIMTLADFLPEVEVYERGIRRGIRRGIKTGREEGREEGRHQERIEMAKSLFLKGTDMDFIANVTKLAKAELKKILS